jgi:hypothetical protein
VTFPPRTSPPRASQPRIVSLVPSLTELLIDLGLAPWIVGRTGFCIHPAQAVAGIPKVGGTKDVNLAKIEQLAPTHVFVNIDENEWPTVEKIRQWTPHVIVTHPCVPQDNLALIDQVLNAFTPDFIANSSIFIPGTALKRQFLTALDQMHAVHQCPQQVLYLIWRAPWMTVARDTYISRMLALIGWQTWPDAQGGNTGAARYPTVEGTEPWLAQIDRVLLSSEPYRFGAQHVQEVQTWLPQAQVQLVDGELLSWYGSRALRGLAYLRELGNVSEPGEVGGMVSPTDSNTSSV